MLQYWLSVFKALLYATREEKMYGVDSHCHIDVLGVLWYIVDGLVAMIFSLLSEIFTIHIQYMHSVNLSVILDEPRGEKTGFLHMRKQRRRSASQ